jgi:thiol-disulfide isomerase/thioredoxin
MRRLVALAVLLAACSPGAVTTSGPAATTTTVPPVTTATHPTVPTVDHDRPLAPDFTFELADGTTFTLSEAGKPVYLVFWAEWCPICRKELPVVDEISARYAGQVEFIAPAWRSDPGYAEQGAAELFDSGVIRWGLDDEERIFSLYGVSYQPVTILIAADRTVYDQWAGVRDLEEIEQAIEGLIAVTG